MTDTSSAIAPGVTADGPGGWQRLRWLITPVVLVAALVALYRYLQSLRLDSIERRMINGTFILTLFRQHLAMVAVSSLLVIVIAIPLGVLLTRRGGRWVGVPLLGLADIGQAIPSIGILVLLAITVGFGFWMAVIALVLVSILPVLRNTMVGLRGVDPVIIDAARGMGLSARTILFRVELPLAVPVILAGLRVALILNVASATLATYTNAGGLGTLIARGIAVDRYPVLLTGSVLTAVLALAVDWLAGLAERVLKPRGL